MATLPPTGRVTINGVTYMGGDELPARYGDAEKKESKNDSKITKNSKSKGINNGIIEPID